MSPLSHKTLLNNADRTKCGCSRVEHTCVDLHLDQQPRRVFDPFLDPPQERDRFATIDDPVIVGQRDVHHRADDDLAVAGDGAVLDRVQTEDRALWRVEDRRAEERAVHAAVADCERAALKFVELDFVFGGPLAKVADRLFDLGKAHQLGIA